jgi:hypothetical protein
MQHIFFSSLLVQAPLLLVSQSRRHNSVSPVVWGRIVATPRGTRVKVTLFIHAFAAIFMAIWFLMVARFMIPDTEVFPVGIVFPIIRVAMIGWGFFPEARKNRNLLTKAVLNPSITEFEAQTTLDGY